MTAPIGGAAAGQKAGGTGAMSTAEQSHQRHQFDFYQTPLPHVQAAFDLLPVSFTPSWVLDPGAGTGVWGQEARRRYPNARIAGVELRDVPQPEEYAVWYSNTSFVDAPVRFGCSYNLVVGNPPFKLSEEFIRYSIKALWDGGYLLFLLRLNYLESQSRGRGLWREYPPFRIGVYSSRPSFTGDGRTDPTGYMACLWQRGYQGETTLRWLNTDADDHRMEWQQSLLVEMGAA